MRFKCATCFCESAAQLLVCKHHNTSSTSCHMFAHNKLPNSCCGDARGCAVMLLALWCPLSCVCTLPSLNWPAVLKPKQQGQPQQHTALG
jgi:hypothetical protein